LPGPSFRSPSPCPRTRHRHAQHGIEGNGPGWVFCCCPLDLAVLGSTFAVTAGDVGVAVALTNRLCPIDSSYERFFADPHIPHRNAR
jgi:hypothetical protein